MKMWAGCAGGPAVRPHRATAAPMGVSMGPGCQRIGVVSELLWQRFEMLRRHLAAGAAPPPTRQYQRNTICSRLCVPALACPRIIWWDNRPIWPTAINLSRDPPLIGAALELVGSGPWRM